MERRASVQVVGNTPQARADSAKSEQYTTHVAVEWLLSAYRVEIGLDIQNTHLWSAYNG